MINLSYIFVRRISIKKDEENSIDDMIELLELQEKSVEDKLKELHADYDHVQKTIRFYKEIKKAMLISQ